MVSGATVSVATRSLLAGVNKPSDVVDTKLSTILLDFFFNQQFFVVSIVPDLMMWALF